MREESDQMVMHVCSRLMSIAELSIMDTAFIKEAWGKAEASAWRKMLTYLDQPNLAQDVDTRPRSRCSRSS